MKSIKNLAVMTAATLALVATGCQSKHKTKTETAKAENRAEQHVDNVEHDTTEAADGVAEMGRDIDREARAMETDMEKATASTRDDLEDAFAEGEKNADETAKDTVAGVDKAGDDVADEIDLQSDKAEEDVDATAKKAEKDTKANTKKAESDTKAAVNDADKTVDDAAMKAEKDTKAATKKAEKDTKATAKEAEKDVQSGADALDGKKVGAEVQKIDKDKRVVVFSIKDSAEEIQLQAGKEMTVNFAEIAALTGLTEEEAIDKMHEGEDLEVRVLGVGDAMKIVKVDIGRF